MNIWYISTVLLLPTFTKYCHHCTTVMASFYNGLRCIIFIPSNIDLIPHLSGTYMRIHNETAGSRYIYDISVSPRTGGTSIFMCSVWFVLLCGLHFCVIYISAWFTFLCDSHFCVIHTCVLFTLLCDSHICDSHFCVIHTSVWFTFLCDSHFYMMCMH